MTGWLVVALLWAAPVDDGGAELHGMLLQHTLALAVLALLVPRLLVRASRLLRAPADLALVGLIIGAGLGVVRAEYLYGAAEDAWQFALPAALVLAMRCRGWSDRERRRVVASVLVVGGGIGWAYATLRLVGLDLPEPLAFINRNYLAAYLLVPLAVVAGRAWQRRGRVGAGAAIAAAGALAGIVTTSSRGALMAVAGLVLAVTVAAVARLGWRRSLPVLVVAAVVGGAGATSLVARLARSDDPFLYTRGAIWRASGAVVADHPLRGVGPGMFEHVAHRYNFAQTEGPTRFPKKFRSPHSEALLVGAELGVLGLVLVVLLLLELVRELAVETAGATRRELRTGAALALAMVGIHAAVDLVLHVPAVLWTLAVLVGVARRPVVDGAPIRGARPLQGAVFASVLALWYAAELAPWRAATVHRRAASGVPEPTAVARAVSWNPWQPYYRQSLAAAELRAEAARATSETVPTPSLRVATSAARQLAEAVRLWPGEASFRRDQARLFRTMLGGALPVTGTAVAAERAYREAAALAPHDAFVRLELATFLAQIGRPAAAAAALGAALELEPNLIAARLYRVRLALERGDRAAARAEIAAVDQTLARWGRAAPGDPYVAAVLAVDEDRLRALRSEVR